MRRGAAALGADFALLAGLDAVERAAVERAVPVRGFGAADVSVESEADPPLSGAVSADRRWVESGGTTRCAAGFGAAFLAGDFAGVPGAGFDEPAVVEPPVHFDPVDFDPVDFDPADFDPVDFDPAAADFAALARGFEVPAGPDSAAGFAARVADFPTVVGDESAPGVTARARPERGVGV